MTLNIAQDEYGMWFDTLVESERVIDNALAASRHQQLEAER